MRRFLDPDGAAVAVTDEDKVVPAIDAEVNEAAPRFLLVSTTISSTAGGGGGGGGVGVGIGAAGDSLLASKSLPMPSGPSAAASS
jgi:hypothetical protein